MIDTSKYTIRGAKPLPVLLLLDVSKTMRGTKIESLKVAVQEMIEAFSHLETEVQVSAITFGKGLEQPFDFTPCTQLTMPDLTADGTTPLGPALEAAYDMFTIDGNVPRPCFVPVVVLVSDGKPDKGWEEPLKKFITDEKTSKIKRIAVAIGADADIDVLKKFVEGSTNQIYEASEASSIPAAFQNVTTFVVGVAKKVTVPRQKAPEAKVPKPSAGESESTGTGNSEPLKSEPEQQSSEMENYNDSMCEFF